MQQSASVKRLRKLSVIDEKQWKKKDCRRLRLWNSLELLKKLLNANVKKL